MSAVDGAVKDRGETLADGAREDGLLVVAATEAPDRLPEMIERAIAGKRSQITRYGKGKAYIVGAEDFEAFLEFQRVRGR